MTIPESPPSPSSPPHDTTRNFGQSQQPHHHYQEHRLPNPPHTHTISTTRHFPKPQLRTASVTRCQLNGEMAKSRQCRQSFARSSYWNLRVSGFGIRRGGAASGGDSDSSFLVLSAFCRIADAYSDFGARRCGHSSISSPGVPIPAVGGFRSESRDKWTITSENVTSPLIGLAPPFSQHRLDAWHIALLVTHTDTALLRVLSSDRLFPLS